MSEILNMLSYHFMQRALIVGVLVSLCAALLGVSLVLKRFSMIGDGLSHVGFGALAVASALGLAPLAVAVPVVVAAAVFLLRLRKSSRVKGDAVLSVVLSLAVLALFVLLYPRIFAVTFDEDFSRATGTNTELYNTLLAVLTAVTVVLGMRMMGALLISSLIIFPALAAMRLCKSFKAVVITAGAISVACFLAGLTGSYFLETPTGASIVAADLIAFAAACAIGRVHRV